MTMHLGFTLEVMAWFSFEVSALFGVFFANLNKTGEEDLNQLECWAATKKVKCDGG